MIIIINPTAAAAPRDLEKHLWFRERQQFKTFVTFFFLGLKNEVPTRDTDRR